MPVEACETLKGTAMLFDPTTLLGISTQCGDATPLHRKGHLLVTRMACVAVVAGALSLATALFAAPTMSYANEPPGDSIAGDQIAFNYPAVVDYDCIALDTSEDYSARPTVSDGSSIGADLYVVTDTGSSSAGESDTEALSDENPLAYSCQSEIDATQVSSCANLIPSSDSDLNNSALDPSYVITYVKCDPNGNLLNGPDDMDSVQKSAPIGTTVNIRDVDPDFMNHFDGYVFAARTSAGYASTDSVTVTGSGFDRMRLLFVPGFYSYVISVVDDDGSFYDGGAVNYRSNVTWDSIVAFEENGVNSDTFNTTYKPKPGYKVGKFFYKLERNMDNSLSTDFLCPDSMKFGDIVNELRKELRKTGEFFNADAPLQLYGTFVMRNDYQVEFDVSGLSAGDNGQPNNRVGVSWDSRDLSPVYDALVAAPVNEVVWTYRSSSGKMLAVSDDTSFADVYTSGYGDDASYGFVTLKAVYASEFSSDDGQENPGQHQGQTDANETGGQESSDNQNVAEDGGGQSVPPASGSPSGTNLFSPSQADLSSEVGVGNNAASNSNSSILIDKAGSKFSYATRTDSSIFELASSPDAAALAAAEEPTAIEPPAPAVVGDSNVSQSASGDIFNPLAPVGVVLVASAFGVYALRRKRLVD